MAEYSARELMAQLPRLKAKQTVFNEWERVISDMPDMAAHEHRRGQARCFDDVAAAELMRRLEPRYGDEGHTDARDVEATADLAAHYRDELARMSRERDAESARWQSQLDAKAAEADGLRAELAEAREARRAAEAESAALRSQLAGARETLARISSAGLFARKRRMARDFLALPPGQP